MADEPNTDRRTVLKSAVAGLGVLGAGGAAILGTDAGLGSGGGDAAGGTNGTAGTTPTPVRTVRTPARSNGSSGTSGAGSGSSGSNASSGTGGDGSDSGGIGTPSPGAGDGSARNSSTASGNDSTGLDLGSMESLGPDIDRIPDAEIVGHERTGIAPTRCYRGDPSRVADSGAVKVEVTPDSKSTGSDAKGEKHEEEGTEMICTTQQRDLREGGGEVILLDPQLSTIWPGAILEAGSIANGQFSPALSQSRLDDEQPEDVREPIQLSISPSAVSGNATTTLQTPTVGNYRTAKNRLLSRFDDSATPAAMSVEIKRIHSEEQLDVELGVHFDSSNVQIDNEFDFQSEERTNKLLATVEQRYYSVDVSTPNPTGDGFVESDCQPLHRNDVLINSVSYGRILLFAIESKYSHERVENALDVSVDASGKQVDTNVDVGHEQVLKESSFSMQVIGGSATNGARTVSGFGEDALPALKQWIEDGATFDPDSSPGKPIAYQAKYPKTLDTANVYLTTRYTARNCYPVTRKYRVHNVSWKIRDMSDQEPGNKEEIYGDIYVNAWHFGDDVHGLKFPPRGAPKDGSVWDKDRSQFVEVGEGKRTHIPVDETFYFENINDLRREDSYIQVAARPKESDLGWGGDDYDELRKEKWFLDEAPSDPNTSDTEEDGGKFTIVWNDHGSELELTFDIHPIPP